MIDDCKKKYKWEFVFHKENFKTAKRTQRTPANTYDTDYGIDDGDFKKIMEILQKGKFKI